MDVVDALSSVFGRGFLGLGASFFFTGVLPAVSLRKAVNIHFPCSF